MDFLPSFSEFAKELLLAVVISLILGTFKYLKTKKFTIRSLITGFLGVYFLVTIISMALVEIGKNKMKTIVDAKYGVERVVVDGKKFINCEFNGSEIVIYGRKPFQLRGSIFRNCLFSFKKEAEMTVNVLRVISKDTANKAFFQGMLDVIYQGRVIAK